MKELTFKKIRAATQSYGRGSDNMRTPAIYGIFKDNEQVGVIRGDAVGYMGARRWHVCNNKFVSLNLCSSLNEAKIVAAEILEL